MKYRNLLTGELYTWAELIEMFGEMLDDVYGKVTIVDGVEIETSKAFMRLFPKLYTEHFGAWLDGEIEQGVYREER